MSFPRYPAYKDSGVEWLGEVPAQWDVLGIKRVCAVVGGSTPKSDQEAYWDGDIVWVTPADLSRLIGFEISDSLRTITSEGLASCGTTLVPQGSVVLSTRAPIGSLGIAAKELCTNQGCKALVPNDIGTRFLAYVLTASNEALNFRGKGTTFLELSGDELAAFKIPLPLSSEQAAIATFLDRETAKIDALVAEQERLIALLKEKRQAVISHAVTKGLDPSVPMKDSGVKWLGEVPGHWEVCALRHVIAAIEQGWSPECYAREAEDQEWGVLKAGCLNGGNFRPSENKALPPELPPEEAYEVRVGDVLMSRASGSPELVGSTAVVKATRERLMLSDKIFRLKLQGFVNAAFFVAALNSRPLRIQIENALSGGNGMANNLPQPSLLTFAMAVPPLTEQAPIAVFLEQETAKLDTLMTEARTAITLLQERRTALISAAVTGQIDVRGAPEQAP